MIFKNATLLCGGELEVVRGYLVLEGGVIKEVGEGMCPKKKAVDLKRGVVFPAFTNAHVHLGDAVAEDMGVYEGLERRVGPGGTKFQMLKEREGELPGGIRSALAEMLSGGTTAFCDFREGGVKGVQLLRACMSKDQDGVILGRPDGDLDGLLEACDGVGISGTADYREEELRAIARATRRKGKLLGVHAAEVEDDVEAALRLKPSFMVHLTRAGNESLELLREEGVPLVLCPRANAVLGAGLPRMKELMEENLVALGTDNVMVNSPSMLREAEFAFKTARGLSRDPTLDGREILKAATLNGRKLLGLGSGAIEEGEEANFIILGRRKYLYDPIVAILHRYEACDIRGIVKKRVLRLR